MRNPNIMGAVGYPMLNESPALISVACPPKRSSAFTDGPKASRPGRPRGVASVKQLHPTPSLLSAVFCSAHRLPGGSRCYGPMSRRGFGERAHD